MGLLIISPAKWILQKLWMKTCLGSQIRCLHSGSGFFPNSLKFPCSGLLTGWIFRASNITITPENNLPLWVVYYRTTGTDQLSFTLREGSGNIAGVTKMADGTWSVPVLTAVSSTSRGRRCDGNTIPGISFK